MKFSSFFLFFPFSILFFSLMISATLHAESPTFFHLIDFASTKRIDRPVSDIELYRGQSYGSVACLVPTNGNTSYVVPVATGQNYGSAYGTTGGSWVWQALPSGTIYRNYLAGPNESRISSVWNYDDDTGWLADVTLGGRLPLLRYGPRNTWQATGFQVEIEGATQLRVDMDKNLGVDATNFKFGVPLSFGNDMLQFKTGYYHVSSNMTDRTVYVNGVPVPKKELDYSRDSWMLGISCQFPRALRVYAEADYAFSGERMKPWHFQFGAEYSPLEISSGLRGNMFAAVNLRLLEEHDFDGNINVQLGWQWRGDANRIFRVGVQYLGGVSEQYEYIRAGREHKIGIGLWYDF